MAVAERSHMIQKRGKLTENQDPMSLLGDRPELIEEDLELRGGDIAILFIHQLRMKTKLSHSRQGAENLKAIFLQATLVQELKNLLTLLLQVEIINSTMLAIEIKEEHLLCLGWKVFGNLFLIPTQEKRSHSSSQALQPFLIGIFLNGDPVLFFEMFWRNPENPRISTTLNI